MTHLRDPDALPPKEALQRLVEGNLRFRGLTGGSLASSWKSSLARESQRPFAVVLGCSDSRTPVEILFDEGFGSLFVVRVAGNIVAPSIVGSIEFAASQFGTRLVVVMGHTHCGAIKATVRAIQTGRGSDSRNIRDITDRISPHVEDLVHAHRADAEKLPKEELLSEALRANVRASVSHLRHGSRVLEEQVRSGWLSVVGAEYELETGRVRFFEGVESVLVGDDAG